MGNQCIREELGAIGAVQGREGRRRVERMTMEGFWRFLLRVGTSENIPTWGVQSSIIHAPVPNAVTSAFASRDVKSLCDLVDGHGDPSRIRAPNNTDG